MLRMEEERIINPDLKNELEERLENSLRPASLDEYIGRSSFASPAARKANVLPANTPVSTISSLLWSYRFLIFANQCRCLFR